MSTKKAFNVNSKTEEKLSSELKRNMSSTASHTAKQTCTDNCGGSNGKVPPPPSCQCVSFCRCWRQGPVGYGGGGSKQQGASNGTPSRLTARAQVTAVSEGMHAGRRDSLHPGDGCRGSGLTACHKDPRPVPRPPAPGPTQRGSVSHPVLTALGPNTYSLTLHQTPTG